MAPHCICGCDPNNKSRPSHHHWCPKTRSEPCITRHNTVVKTLASIARYAGLSPIVEPRKLYSIIINNKNKDDPKVRERRSRPDIVIAGSIDTLLVDVSLVHPLSPSYVAARRRDDDGTGGLWPIKKREGIKFKRYEQTAKHYHGGRVMPFVVDAFGAFGECAEDMLKWLADEAPAERSSSTTLNN